MSWSCCTRKVLARKLSVFASKVGLHIESHTETRLHEGEESETQWAERGAVCVDPCGECKEMGRCVKANWRISNSTAFHAWQSKQLINWSSAKVKTFKTNVRSKLNSGGTNNLDMGTATQPHVSAFYPSRLTFRRSLSFYTHYKWGGGARFFHPLLHPDRLSSITCTCMYSIISGTGTIASQLTGLWKSWPCKLCRGG